MDNRPPTSVSSVVDSKSNNTQQTTASSNYRQRSIPSSIDSMGESTASVSMHRILFGCHSIPDRTRRISDYLRWSCVSVITGLVVFGCLALFLSIQTRKHKILGNSLSARKFSAAALFLNILITALFFSATGIGLMFLLYLPD